MTAYNREAFIAGAIESVLASSFGDFELMVVDDGSTDSSADIAAEYAKRDSRVRLQVNSSNLGDYPNRNMAASLARGKYLKFLDSDDMLYPYGLEFMVRAMEANPQCALGIGRSAPDPDVPFPYQVDPAEAYRRHFIGGGLLNSGPSATILSTEKFRDLGGFDELRFVGDESTWLKLAARFPVVLLPRDLVWWRRHEGQEFRIGHATGGYAEAQFRVELDALLSDDCPLSREEVRRSINGLRRRHSRALIRLAVLDRNPKEFLRVMRASGLSAPQLFSSALLPQQ
jgi:glycosyltransferase involved in cell wall biosynthesis